MEVSVKTKSQLPSISQLISTSSETKHLERKETKGGGSCFYDFIPKRYIFILIGFLGTTLAWTLITNLNFAIVYMVDRSNVSVIDVKPSNECLANIPSVDMAVKNKTVIKGEFYWKSDAEGIAVAACFYGQILAYLPGGRLSEIYGAKRVLIISILLSSLLTCLSPEAARLSVYAFIVCRFFIGVTRAPVTPTFYFLMSRWVPQTERNFTVLLIYAGFGLGAFVAFLSGGELIATGFLGGWPSVFYVYGICGVLWTLLCYCCLYGTPKEHPTISVKELNYISTNMGPTKQKQIKAIPWKAMLTSVPLWSLACGYFGQVWIHALTTICQAPYMGTILNLGSVQNGELSCTSQLIKAIFGCACGYPMDWALKNKYVSVTFIRKGAATLSTLCGVIGMVGILFSGCDPTLNTIFFGITGLAVNLVSVGMGLNCLDLAPNLSGTVSGIMATVAILPWVIIPSFVGWLTEDERSMAQWRYVYYWSISVVLLTTLIFTVFGSTEPQDWGSENKKATGDKGICNTDL